VTLSVIGAVVGEFVGWGFLDPEAQRAVRVTDRLGGVFVFQVETGAFEYHVGENTCQ
jgi:hypothetical protein